jgi:hypothetical protein
VGSVLRTPSEPLETSARADLQTQFGRDFTGVRVHTDSQAGHSALSLGAAAYTVGRHIVFAPGRYAPQSTTGRQLIAHELAHVLQQDADSDPESVEVASPHEDHEREAATLSRYATSGATVGAQPRGTRTGSPALQRSLLGGIVGGLAGAAGGAVIGGLLGGPIGAVVGGLVSLVGGALIGDAATTRKRKLSSQEVAYAKEVFHDSIDFTEVTITRDSMLSTGAPKTLGNTIHLRSDWGHFVGDTLELTQVGRETLIHEMGHVWQYQNGGLAYIPESLWAQFKGFMGAGSRDAAYNWREAHRAGVPWERWNPEQQASAIEDYNKLLRKSHDGTATIQELSTLSVLLPYMQKVWAQQGAPHFETPDLQAAPL